MSQLPGCPPNCPNTIYGNCPSCYAETGLGCPHGEVCSDCLAFPEEPRLISGETRDECLLRLERDGLLDSECLGCREFYSAPDPLSVFAPRHRASDRCESGKRPHCTCDTCF